MLLLVVMVMIGAGRVLVTSGHLAVVLQLRCCHITMSDRVVSTIVLNNWLVSCNGMFVHPGSVIQMDVSVGRSLLLEMILMMQVMVRVLLLLLLL